ncbi:MAG TPA: dihydrofolate reductase family protein [Anaerolineaceae bacterium]
MNRPKVILFDCASLDGCLTIAPEYLLFPQPDPRWIALAGSSDLDVMRWLVAHHQPQATLEGSGSFVREGEEPESLPPFEGDGTVLYQDYLPEKIVKRAGHKGWFCAVDGRGRIRWYYKEFPSEEWQGWHALVWVHESTPATYLAYLRKEEIPYLVAGDGQVDLSLALQKMREKLDVTCLLSTAGGRLNGALVRAGLVDEVNVEFLPGIIGGVTTPALFTAPNLQKDQNPFLLHLISVHSETGGKVWLRYEVVKECSNH